MNEDLFVAKKVMDTGYNVVICYKGMVFTSKKIDIEAVMEFLDSGFDLSMYAASCNYISLATAYLFLKLKIKFIYAYEITIDALNLLESNNVRVLYQDKINGLDKPYNDVDDMIRDKDIDEIISIIKENIGKN